MFLNKCIIYKVDRFIYLNIGSNYRLFVGQTLDLIIYENLAILLNFVQFSFNNLVSREL